MLASPTAMALAFKAALERKGIVVPEGTAIPQLFVPAWSGPRDRG